MCSGVCIGLRARAREREGGGAAAPARKPGQALVREGARACRGSPGGESGFRVTVSQR